MSTTSNLVNGLTEVGSMRNDQGNRIFNLLGNADADNEAGRSKKRPHTVNPSSTKASNQVDQEHEESEKKETQQKILITGDDVLIEYVNRLVVSFKKLVNDPQPDAEKVIEQFIGYYVWHTPDMK